MNCRFALSLAALLTMSLVAQAAGITGKYIEARTCDIWTGPCFANADTFQGGKHAVIGWKVDQGKIDDITLDGLSIVAVITASDTLGQDQTGMAKVVLIVDKKADKAQRKALIRLAKQEGGELVKNVIAVEYDSVDITVCDCKG